MRVLIITPAPRHSRAGNRVTARRWAALLRRLGHRVSIDEEYRAQPCDLVVALHARKSAESVERVRSLRTDIPVVLALTGTDVYGDIHTSAPARRSLELARRLVVLQPLAIDELTERLRPKARVIYQSARQPPGDCVRDPRFFDACVLGHLRPVKDPLRAALAARLLPGSSRIRIQQVGAALSEDIEQEARAEEAQNPRYRWLGERPRLEALRILARSRVLVLTSKLEGGANVVSEAIACGVPVLSARIPGSIGILGPDYPGYFPVGDAQALATLLLRAEADARFYADLETWCVRLAALVDPRRECEDWSRLLAELS